MQSPRHFCEWQESGSKAQRKQGSASLHACASLIKSKRADELISNSLDYKDNEDNDFCANLDIFTNHRNNSFIAMHLSGFHFYTKEVQANYNSAPRNNFLHPTQ